MTAETSPTKVKVVGTFHVPFTKFTYELGACGRHSESACYFCRRRLVRVDSKRTQQEKERLRRKGKAVMHHRTPR